MKVALTKQQAPKEPGERPSLAIFADLEAVQNEILTFYPDPKPRGNTMFGVYGVWEEDSKPYVFFVSGIIQEGAYRGRLWIEESCSSAAKLRRIDSFRQEPAIFPRQSKPTSDMSLVSQPVFQQKKRDTLCDLASAIWAREAGVLAAERHLEVAGQSYSLRRGFCR